jgi:hypothetical protein
MTKQWYWYDDATLYAAFFAWFIVATAAIPCLVGPSFCVSSVAFGALVAALTTTTLLIYLIVTFKRRPDAASALREDAKIR